MWTGKAVRLNRRYKIGFRKIKGVRKPFLISSPEYASFIESMSVDFRKQNMGFKTFTGKVTVLLLFSLGGRQQDADTDAYNKQVLDALEHAGIYENDNQVTFQAAMNIGGDKDSKIDVFEVIVSELEKDINLFMGSEISVPK